MAKDRNEAVYVATDNNNFISYEANSGSKLWEVILNGTCKGTPVLYRKKIYIHTDAGYLYSIDILTGEIYKSVATMFPSKLAWLQTAAKYT